MDDLSIRTLDSADHWCNVLRLRIGHGLHLVHGLFSRLLYVPTLPPLSSSQANPSRDTIYAASVLAANSVLRSLFGTAFPLFTTQIYKSLGNQWASSIPAFLVLGCVPFPFLFCKYGRHIRAKSKYTSEAAKMMEMMRRRHVVAGGEPKGQEKQAG